VSLLSAAEHAALRDRALALAGAASLDEGGRRALDLLVERLADTYPFGEPRYAGQMLKPPHPVAWAAYATTMLLNPNNHALDGGPATARLEIEVVEALGSMFGLDEPLGHLTGSGTIANLEALFVAREERPGAVVLHGENAHYTHGRMCDLLGVAHESVPEDAFGRLDVAALAARLERGNVGTVVATLGTTSLGALDPIAAIADLCTFGVRLHVDAAYGGFFTLVAGADSALGLDPATFAAVSRADSVVVDPHKHGLQPYGCGAILFADSRVARHYTHASPYTYFTSEGRHLGEISLECSRSGAAAAALWTTLQALPLDADGLGTHVAAARRAALIAAKGIEAANAIDLLLPPELDIVCMVPAADSAARITAATEEVFTLAADAGLHLAKLSVASEWLAGRRPGLIVDQPMTTILRSVLMKEEHEEQAALIVKRIDALASVALA
jgi:glutamate/tyrosine decarboxylase-like PLP-dependent enzyme